LGEIRRVLEINGRMLFMEPLADNPLLKLFRFLTSKSRTTDERPFYRADLRQMVADWQVERSIVNCWVPQP
jgi:hypothetical protein